jgi:hypothetical protein
MGSFFLVGEGDLNEIGKAEIPAGQKSNQSRKHKLGYTKQLIHPQWRNYEISMADSVSITELSSEQPLLVHSINI